MVPIKGVAAHGERAERGQDQDGEVRFWMKRRKGQDGMPRGMTARLPYQHLGQVRMVGQQICLHLSKGVTLQFRKAVGHEPGGFSSGVGVDHVQAADEGHC